MTPQSTGLSVVVPVYMGSPFLRELHIRVTASVAPLFDDYELVLVNDASPDDSWPLIRALCEADPHVKGIHLSRNFGQHYAITAGLTRATGEWIVVMDCDLQDIPEEIPKLYRKACEGHDTVFAQRHHRQDSGLKRFSSRAFYSVFSYLTDTRLDPSVANFGIYHRRVIRAVLSMGDKTRYFPTMAQWVGFQKAYLPVVHGDRKAGASSYSVSKLLLLATNTIVAFSDKPLRLFVYAGFGTSFLSLCIAVFYYALTLMGRIRVQGFASLILSLWFIGGVLMSSMGVLGIYLGRTFDQVKGRPVFIIAETANLEDRP